MREIFRARFDISGKADAGGMNFKTMLAQVAGNAFEVMQVIGHPAEIVQI